MPAGTGVNVTLTFDKMVSISRWTITRNDYGAITEVSRNGNVLVVHVINNTPNANAVSAAITAYR